MGRASTPRYKFEQLAKLFLVDAAIIIHAANQDSHYVGLADAVPFG